MNVFVVKLRIDEAISCFKVGDADGAEKAVRSAARYIARMAPIVPSATEGHYFTEKVVEDRYAPVMGGFSSHIMFPGVFVGYGVGDRGLLKEIREVDGRQTGRYLEVVVTSKESGQYGTILSLALENGGYRAELDENPVPF